MRGQVTSLRNHSTQKLLSPLPVSFSWGWTRSPPLFCCSLSWRQSYLKRVHGSWSGFPQAHLSEPTPLEAEVTHERGGNEKGHSSDLWSDVATGYLQLRDGFCYDGWGGCTHNEAPPASAGLRFQPFRERRGLALSWNGETGFLEKCSAVRSDNKQVQQQLSFCLWPTLSGCTPRCKPAVVFGNNYITDALAAVSKSFQSLPGTGCEDFILVDWSWVNPQRLYQIRRRGEIRVQRRGCFSNYLLSFLKSSNKHTNTRSLILIHSASEW